MSRREWVVYSKPPFGEPEHVLKYLAATRTGLPSPTEDSSASRTARCGSAGVPPAENAAPGDIKSVDFALRADGDPGLLTNSVRAALRQVDPGLLINDLRTQTQQIDNSIAFDRTFAELSMCFGVLALLLAAIGLYGTLSYSVTRRTRELGIRMALGAQRGTLLRSVLVDGLRWVLAGILLGAVAAALSGRIVRSLLFGVQPLDGVSFLSAPLLLILVAILAAFWPAHRAASLDPMRALRTD